MLRADKKIKRETAAREILGHLKKIASPLEKGELKALAIYHLLDYGEGRKLLLYGFVHNGQEIGVCLEGEKRFFLPVGTSGHLQAVIRYLSAYKPGLGVYSGD